MGLSASYIPDYAGQPSSDQAVKTVANHAVQVLRRT